MRTLFDGLLPMIFKNRAEAGKLLAERLAKYKDRKDALVLAIPRGGLAIGVELSKALHVPLDIIVAKKIGFPGNEEYAVGAVGPFKTIVLNETAAAEVPHSYIKAEIERLSVEVEKRYSLYRGKKAPPHLDGKTVIITDDGVATGTTLRACIQVVRQQKPSKVVVAVPVGPADTVERLKGEADEVVCLFSPQEFFAIGEFYQDFAQLDDSTAAALLKAAWKAFN